MKKTILMTISNLKSFNYKFDKGPLLLIELRKENFREGNCRLAVQYYLYKIHNRYFNANLILSPHSALNSVCSILEFFKSP